MLKRCSNCEHCIVSIKALPIVFIKICTVDRHFVLKPFWEGWMCKHWRAKDGK